MRGRSAILGLLLALSAPLLAQQQSNPLERANLKERQKDVYDRLVAKWLAWNQTMMPEVDESATSNFTADQLADHIGTPPTSRKADIPGPPPAK